MTHPRSRDRTTGPPLYSTILLLSPLPLVQPKRQLLAVLLHPLQLLPLLGLPRQHPLQQLPQLLLMLPLRLPPQLSQSPLQMALNWMQELS